MSFATATMMGGLPYMTPLRITWARPLGDRLQARLRPRRRPDRRQPAGHRSVVAVRRRAGHPVRARAVVRARARLAPARDRRGERCSDRPWAPAASGRRRRCRLGRHRRRSTPGGARRAPAQRTGRRAGRRSGCGARRSSPPATRSSASPTSTAPPTACRCPAWRRRYDCSSSVEHLLYGARLLPVTYGAASGDAGSLRRCGPGRWVTPVRQRRPRVHVRGGPALGHLERGRGRRRQRGDRLAPARPQRRRVRGPASGGAVRRAAIVAARGRRSHRLRAHDSRARRRSTASTSRPLRSLERQPATTPPAPAAPARPRRRLG